MLSSRSLVKGWIGRCIQRATSLTSKEVALFDGLLSAELPWWSLDSRKRLCQDIRTNGEKGDSSSLSFVSC